MSEITITYFGHSCFKVTCNNKSILFDPYEDNNVPGLTLKRGIRVGNVYCSHEHGDHNARELVQSLNSTPFPVTYLTVPHDDCNGTKRGFCHVTFVDVDGITIAHLGDIGRLPTQDEYDALCKAQVILIPCGGYYTIDAKQSKQIIETCKPKLTILMHYRDGEIGYPVLEDIKDIQSIFPTLERLDTTTIHIQKDKLSLPRIITLQIEH